MYWDVVSVNQISDRELVVKFKDGLTGMVRICESFCTGVFEPLLDKNLIGSAKVEYGVVVWPNGLDLAPDTMYKEIKKAPNKCYVIQ